jgi:hypothetical protein
MITRCVKIKTTDILDIRSKQSSRQQYISSKQLRTCSSIVAVPHHARNKQQQQAQSSEVVAKARHEHDYNSSSRWRDRAERKREKLELT